MSNYNPNRVRKGVRTGGQFATGAKSEATLSLAPQEPTHREVAEQKAATIANWARQHGKDGWDFTVNDNFPELAVQEIAPSVDRAVLIDEMYTPMVRAAMRAEQHADTYPNAEQEFARLHDQLTDRLEREQRWINDPNFVAPGYDYSEQATGGPVVYRTSVGDKYSGYTDAAAIAKNVRADLKQAQACGYLPNDVKLSVRSSKFSGGQSLRVAIDGLRDEDIYQPAEEGQIGRRYTARTQELRERVDGLLNAYNRRETSIETDYCNVSYYGHVEVVDETSAKWNQEMKEDAKRKAQARAQARANKAA